VSSLLPLADALKRENENAERVADEACAAFKWLDEEFADFKSLMLQKAGNLETGIAAMKS